MTKKKTSKKKTASRKPRKSISDQVAEEVAKQIPKVETGMAVAMPNTVEEKMRAICDLASAVSSLAEAVASTNVNIRVENCSFQNHETGLHFDGTGKFSDNRGSY